MKYGYRIPLLWAYAIATPPPSSVVDEENQHERFAKEVSISSYLMQGQVANFHKDCSRNHGSILQTALSTFI